MRALLELVIPTEASRPCGSRSGGIALQRRTPAAPPGTMRHAIPPLRGAKARRYGRDDGVVGWRVVLAVLLALLALPAQAAIAPDEILADPALEARARGITKQLRCLVCQNQSIDDSNAPLARDLRLLVRERLKGGDSDGAALAFVVARYGDFVLLRPPLKATTWLLWFGPALLLIAAGLFLWLRAGRKSVVSVGPAPLDEEERNRLAALIGEKPPRNGGSP